MRVHSRDMLFATSKHITNVCCRCRSMLEDLLEILYINEHSTPYPSPTHPSAVWNAAGKARSLNTLHSVEVRNRSSAAEQRAQPVLVTALEFCSPYPLLIGACIGGAAVIWRVPDCVCVQVRRVGRR